MIDGEKGKPFVINETGWGEFEITIKLYYATDSGEKAQTLYHHLRLHPYGKNEEEKAKTRKPNGDIIAWNYEEQLFNEPYEAFFNVLTSGAHLRPGQGPASSSTKQGSRARQNAALDPNAGVVYARSALVPKHLSAEQPFSKETEELETERIAKALATVMGWIDETKAANAEKEKKLQALKAENAAAGALAPAPGKKKAGP